jgi:hypothetical protein
MSHQYCEHQLIWIRGISLAYSAGFIIVRGYEEVGLRRQIESSFEKVSSKVVKVASRDTFTVATIVVGSN